MECFKVDNPFKHLRRSLQHLLAWMVLSWFVTSSVLKKVFLKWYAVPSKSPSHPLNIPWGFRAIAYWYVYLDSLFWKVTIEAMETWTISLFDWTSSYMYPLSCTIPAAGSWHCFWTMLGTINRRTGTLGAGASTATRAAWQEPWNRNDQRNRVMWCSEVLMKFLHAIYDDQFYTILPN